jgi:DNA-directed RNA polymerase specialized sigma24 family protein
VHARNTAGKRGGGVDPLSLEFEQAEGRLRLEASTGETPERTFDRMWALTLLDRVMDRLGNDHFEALKPFLTGEEPQLSYSETAGSLGISEGAVKVAVHRLRRKFRDIVRDEIAQTVSSPNEVEDELRHLWSAVGR